MTAALSLLLAATALAQENLGPLAATALDRGRDFKERVMAISRLSLSRDPAALAPLKRLLLDVAESDEIRSAAAAGVPSIDVSRQAQRACLCAALVQKDLPRQTRDAVLVSVSDLGCDQAENLERIIKQSGSRPDAGQERTALYALKALGRSYSRQSARVLLAFLRYYDPGSRQKNAVLAALLIKGRELSFIFPPAAAEVSDALLAESSYPANAVLALRLLSAIAEPSAASTLLRFLKNRDAEVVTEAAEALASLKEPKTKSRLEHILAHIHEDPRFSPLPGRPDPKLLAQRLEAALKQLQ